MGFPAIAKIESRGSERGSASERSASKPVVPRAMRAADVAYITFRIQTSVTQGLVGLPAVAAVHCSSTKARLWQVNRITLDSALYSTGTM